MCQNVLVQMYHGVMKMNKSKICLLGHARHGKDTVCEILNKEFGINYKTSSQHVGEKYIWPKWGVDRYNTYQEMFDDRINHRKIWYDSIVEYNKTDLTRTAKEIFNDGNQIYAGMRSIDEFKKCYIEGLFDIVVWVDAQRRLPLENSNSMTIKHLYCADHVIDNNYNSYNLNKNVFEFVNQRL